MNPFARKKQLLSALKDIKDDNNPVTCKGCGEKYGERELRENMYVCPVCGRHYRVSAPYRIKTTVDKGTFKEICRSITSGDPLDFPGYGEKLSEARKKTSGRFSANTAARPRLPAQANAPLPNCCNMPTATACARWPWPSSGGAIPRKRKSGDMGNSIRLANPSVSRFSAICCKGWMWNPTRKKP